MQGGLPLLLLLLLLLFLLLLILLLSFSVRRANQSISFESSSSVLFPPPPPSPPFPPPPSGEKERLGPSDRRRSCISTLAQLPLSLYLYFEITNYVFPSDDDEPAKRDEKLDDEMFFP